MSLHKFDTLEKTIDKNVTHTKSVYITSKKHFMRTSDEIKILFFVIKKASARL